MNFLQALGNSNPVGIINQGMQGLTDMEKMKTLEQQRTLQGLQIQQQQMKLSQAKEEEDRGNSLIPLSSVTSKLEQFPNAQQTIMPYVMKVAKQDAGGNYGIPRKEIAPLMDFFSQNQGLQASLDSALTKDLGNRIDATNQQIAELNAKPGDNQGKINELQATLSQLQPAYDAHNASAQKRAQAELKSDPKYLLEMAKTDEATKRAMGVAALRAPTGKKEVYTGADGQPLIFNSSTGEFSPGIIPPGTGPATQQTPGQNPSTADRPPWTKAIPKFEMPTPSISKGVGKGTVPPSAEENKSFFINGALAEIGEGEPKMAFGLSTGDPRRNMFNEGKNVMTLWMANKGISINDLKSQNAADAAAAKSLAQLEGKVDSFETTASANLKLFLDTAKQLGPEGVRVANAAIRAGKLQLGDPIASRYMSLYNDATSEIARVLSGANSGAAPSDSLRKEIRTEVLNPNSSLGQLLSSGDASLQAMNNRRESFRKEAEGGISSRLKSRNIGLKNEFLKDSAPHLGNYYGSESPTNQAQPTPPKALPSGVTMQGGKYYFQGQEVTPPEGW